MLIDVPDVGLFVEVHSKILGFVKLSSIAKENRLHVQVRLVDHSHKSGK